MSSPQGLQQLLHRRSQLEADLAACEKQIADLEEAYLDDTPYGNVVKGFDGFVNAKLVNRSNNPSQGRRQRVPIKDRLFSSSSVTAPINQDDENNQMNDDQYHQ